MPTKRLRRIRVRASLLDEMRWLLVHGPDELYPPFPWAIGRMSDGSIRVDSRTYTEAELRQVWAAHRAAILVDHPDAWAATALGDANKT